MRPHRGHSPGVLRCAQGGTMTSKARTFTIVNLLVIILILAFVASIFMPSLCRAREQANRIKCASNLRQIGQSLALYLQANGGKLPRTTYDPSHPAPVFYTNP